jgi:hypothetical protein
MRRLLALVLLGALAASGTTSFSGATFTAVTRNPGSAVTASIDWTPPTVSLSDPGALLRGNVTLTAAASDARTSVARVTIQYAVAGSSSWADVCTRLAGPYTCTFATTGVADGRYDLRAVATDTQGNIGTSATIANRTVDNVAPVATMVDPGDHLRGTVSLQASAIDAGTGVTSLKIQRTLSGGTNWTDVCTVTSASATCPLVTTSLANDYHDFRAIAVDGAGNTSAPSVVADVLVDNVAPTVTMVDPGTPIRGTITLGATVADAGSGVAALTVQISPAGTNVWTTACTSAEAPWTCRYDTTTRMDGAYDLRAVATDFAGNTGTSATISNRIIDNAQSSVSMEDPGLYLAGTVTLTAAPFSRAGITSVRIQRAVSGTTTWVDVCTVVADPYSCAWDTRTVADGLYDFRAILTDGTSKVTTSATVTARRVDNSLLRGTDVQTINGSSSLGKIEAGDVLQLTYSEQLRPESLIAGWDGTSRPVVVRVRDGNLSNLSNLDDNLEVFTSTALTTPVRVGSINLRGDFVKSGKTMVFNATMSLQTVTVAGVPATRVVVTIGTVSSGGGNRTSGSLAHMVWSPSSLALDLAGNPCSTVPATETGILDKDF